MTEPVGIVPVSSFLDSLGARGQRRAEPRASIAIAGAGCALAVIGALVVAGDTGTAGDGFNKVPGIILSALIVAAGLFTLTAMRQGPIGTAGVVATALGIPPLMFFVTFNENDFPPYSTDAILIVSTIAWLAAYTVGPGRGRPFFLGAGLLGFWLTLMQVTEKIFEAPFGLFGMGMAGSSSFAETGTSVSGSVDSGSFDSSSFDSTLNGPTFHMPDPTTLGLISLGLGVAYLVTSRWLDKRGSHGAATPFALATIPTLLAATIFLADDLEQAGTGLFVTAIGASLAFHGATVGRRFTTWVGGGATAVGVAGFLSDMTDDARIGGMLFMAAGIALVAIGYVVAAALTEPDEMALTLVSATPSAVVPDAPPAPPPSDTAGDDSDWAPPADPPTAPPAAPPTDPPVPGSAPPP